MKSKPIVLIIENSIDVTGALRCITQSAYDLKSFFEFEFVIPKNSGARMWIESCGFYKIHELPMVELGRRFSSIILYLPFLLANAIRLNKIVKQKKVSVIHVNDLYNLLPVAARFFYDSTPYVSHVRFLPDRFPAWLFNFWLRVHSRYAEKIIVVSERLKEMLMSHHKIIVIYDRPPLEVNPELPAGIGNNSHFTFLYLSNFIDGKGQNFALQAFAAIHEVLPNWKLRFVGGDMGLRKNQDYHTRLKRMAEVLKIAKNIEWREFTKCVEQEYKRADIVLNFSESESFSMTCLEALYFGRPLIASDSGGPSEIIENGISAILVENGDIEAMAAAMKDLAMSRSKRELLGLTARHKIRSKFDFERTSLRLKEVYTKAMNKP